MAPRSFQRNTSRHFTGALLWVPAGLVLLSGAARLAAAVVGLQPADPGHTTPQTDWRWLDVANTPYSEAYRASFSYDNARVTVSFANPAPALHVHLHAAGLKPFFAYQVKIEGRPGTDSGERIGFTGRWWREEWNGAQWANGWNLNTKGDGSSPNPNDETYLSEKDIPDSSSPTGLHYRFTPYLLFGYFITDGSGAADVEFTADSSFHVLWKTSQRAHSSEDGPVVSALVQPDPGISPAYDTAVPAVDVGIFGEWERLPEGQVFLPAGAYDCRLLLTEESFHGSGGAGAGFWATAMAAPLHFVLGTAPEITAGPTDTVAHAGDRAVFEISVAQNTAPAPEYQWFWNGNAIPGATSASLAVDPVQAGDAGAYACRITNVCGSVRSRAAWLAVIEADSDADGLDDNWELTYFGTLTHAGAEDFDGDGFSNRQEFLRGTDPTRCRLVLHPGWNDVSIARVPDDHRIAAMLGNAAKWIAGPVWVWEGDHYEITREFLPLRGHWLYCTASEDISVDLAAPLSRGE